MKNITRKELYDLVWKKPITKVSYDFGVLSKTIKDLCIEWEIPLPDQGHWTKLNFGKEVVIKQLDNNEFNPSKIIYSNVDLDRNSSINKQKLIYKSEATKPFNFCYEVKIDNKDYQKHLKLYNDNLPKLEERLQYMSSRENKERIVGEVLGNLYLPIYPHPNIDNSLSNCLIVYDNVINFFKSAGIKRKNKNTFLYDSFEFHLKIRHNRKPIVCEISKLMYSWDGNKIFSSVDLKRIINKIPDMALFIIEECKEQRDCEKRQEEAHLERIKEDEKNRLEKIKKEEEQRKIDEVMVKVRAVKDEEFSDFFSLLHDVEDYYYAEKIRAYIAKLASKPNITNEEKEHLDKLSLKVDWFDPTIERYDEVLGNRRKDIYLNKIHEWIKYHE